MYGALLISHKTPYRKIPQSLKDLCSELFDHFEFVKRLGSTASDASVKFQSDDYLSHGFKASGISGRELGPSGVSPNQRSRWKHAFSPLKHV